MSGPSKLRASVTLIRPPRLDETIERIIALKNDAETLKLDTLAYFLEMSLTEARIQAGHTDPYEEAGEMEP